MHESDSAVRRYHETSWESTAGLQYTFFIFELSLCGRQSEEHAKDVSTLDKLFCPTRGCQVPLRGAQEPLGIDPRTNFTWEPLGIYPKTSEGSLRYP
jgi:hypothetical protein